MKRTGAPGDTMDQAAAGKPAVPAAVALRPARWGLCLALAAFTLTTIGLSLALRHPAGHPGTSGGDWKPADWLQAAAAVSTLLLLGVAERNRRRQPAEKAAMAEREQSSAALRAAHETLTEQTREHSARLQALLADTNAIAGNRLHDETGPGEDNEIACLAERVTAMASALQKSKSSNEAQAANTQRMMDSVRASRNFFHSLVESLPLYLFRKDTEGRYTFVNAAACEGLGKSMEDFLDLTDADLVEPGLAARWRENDEKVIRSGAPLEHEESLPGPTGAKLHFQVIRSPVFNTEGAVVGVQVIALDITARKQAEAELAVTQAQLVASSRQAGMAEIATGVLHNVGNVLNSVNVSATLISEQLRKSKSSSLTKAVQLLADHRADLGPFLTEDPKGRQLPAFLEALSTQLTREQAILTRETESLQHNIEHIKHIVAMQQSYAKAGGLIEPLPLAELAEDALRLHADKLAQAGVEVVKLFQQTPPVMVDKHKTLQILANLISNACHALIEANRPDRRLMVGIATTNSERIQLIVRDNGTGIARENLARIFSHGFTTKRDGHGFGLHSAANSAAEMGGRLTAESDGPGSGATFVLELPIRKADSPARTGPDENRRGSTNRAAA